MTDRTYVYKPHQHIKIWLSNNPDKFMNFENQLRLIDMRIKNPNDKITLVYDSSLLNPSALAELGRFCEENNIEEVDAEDFKTLEIPLSDKEKKLFSFYKAEINNLNAGGNLAVASDILRWLRPVYIHGTYTDFDVPVDTSALPDEIEVESPLLLNIGSLKLGNNELIIANNDYIAIVDGIEGKEQIERVQEGILSVLDKYDSDFIENATTKLGGSSFLYSRISSYMKNRAESEYIERSKKVNQSYSLSSRELRAEIIKITTDKDKFIAFHQTDLKETEEKETEEQVIHRLRKELYDQLGIIKWFFFNKEYCDIKAALAKDDAGFLEYLMKKERSLYIKSIVVCTTGPIEVGKALFGDYVLESERFNSEVTPMSFNHYGFKRAFQSQNSIPLHESVMGMLFFLGRADGEVNDSSWLEEGVALQGTREDKLKAQKLQFEQQFPGELKSTKLAIETNIERLEIESKSGFSLFGISAQARQAKLEALRQTLNCFHEETCEFDIDQFRSVLSSIHSNKRDVYAGLFVSNTQTIMDRLEKMSNQAQMFRVAKIRVAEKEVSTLMSYDEHASQRSYNMQHPIKHYHDFMMAQTGNYFSLSKARLGFWSTLGAGLLFTLKIPVSLPLWLFQRLVVSLAINPEGIKKQKRIHLVGMSNDTKIEDDEEALVVVNLLDHEHQKSTFSFHNPNDKQYIDCLLAEIGLLVNGESSIDPCHNKRFTWEKIHFKGLEFLDKNLTDYFFAQLEMLYGSGVKNTTRSVNLNFYTLSTADGAALDSVETIGTGEDAKPMSERKFVIICMPQQQNYINWIKDARYSAENIGCTVIGFNYRGVDYSKGVVWTENNMVDDTVAQVNRLLALGAKPENIGIEGRCIGGAVATLAAARLHDRGDKVKLYNERSFRSVPRLITGYILPDADSSYLNPLTYLRYFIVGLVYLTIVPIIWLAGWHVDAASAWDRIPVTDKNYSVARELKEDQSPRTFEQSDGMIHDSWASMASKIDEARLSLKNKKENDMTQEERLLISDNPDKHCFMPIIHQATFDGDDISAQAAKRYGKLPHFFSRRFLVSQENPQYNIHKHEVDTFKHFFGKAV